MKIKVIVVIVISLLSFKNSAQETKSYSDAWFLLLNNYEFSEKWSGGSEIHWRNTHFLSKKQQLILRPFITYSPTESPLAYSIGYSYLRSYPYTENAIPATKPEHNIWEQITLSQAYKELSFSHRFRLEHRFQGNLVMNNNQNYTVDDFSSNRFRYRLTVRYPIFNNWFINIFDELWINMNENFQYPAYDRNWLYLGIGYEILKNGNIQVAYLHQNIKKSDNLFEVHPTLQFTFQYDFDFRRKEKNQ
ncbi:DUF2490 domain-containing protein [Mesonia maritima]|uniref:DUF2490 domain-containing protein n=1 Tax=Mesonia maritima TaxID=1793873 RepID=UPI00363527E1